jgi:hypothetical protein
MKQENNQHTARRAARHVVLIRCLYSGFNTFFKRPEAPPRPGGRRNSRLKPASTYPVCGVRRAPAQVNGDKKQPSPGLLAGWRVLITPFAYNKQARIMKTFP